MSCALKMAMVSAIKSSTLLTLVLIFTGRFISAIGEANSECTFGYLNSNIIDETDSTTAAFPDSSLPRDDPLFDFTQWNFPNLNFTCNGYIVKWRLRVNATMESINQRPIPHITTWTLENSFFITSNYILKSITNESQINVTEISGSVYIEYTPLSPVPIQKEDVIGIMMPGGEDDRDQGIRSLFLKLPEGNSSTISCVRLFDSQLIFLQDRMCLNQQEQQSLYIPLVSAIFSLDTLPSTPHPTVAPASSQLATTTTQDTATDSTTIDLAVPPQSEANSNQLVGVIIGAILAGLSLAVIVVLVIFLVLLLTKRRNHKLYNVPGPPQSQNIDNPVHTQIIGSQSIELKNNEAYSLPTTQKISTVDNIVYGPSPATSQIPTENNVAYSQTTSLLQITTGDNEAYGHREDDYATVSDPTEYDYVL